MTMLTQSSRSLPSQASSLFGTPQRTLVLVLIAGLGRTYPRELSRIAELPLVTTQRIVGQLETQGIIATRLLGKQREVSLNPQYLFAKELRALLEALLERTSEFNDKLAAAARRRPRRAGKPQ